MAAGRAGGVATLVVLMTAMLVAFFAGDSAAARSPLSRQQLIPGAATRTALARAVLGSEIGDDEPCCECACIFEWLTFTSTCECRGDWEGSCPAICSKCVCDEDNICSCQDGFSHNDLICTANECPPFEWSAKGRRPRTSSLPANKGSTKEGAV